MSERRTSHAIGLFSWPVNAQGSGTCSAGCARILRGPVRNGDDFRRLLAPCGQTKFLDAVASAGEFQVDLDLADGRRVRLTAACEACETGRVVHGTVEDISNGSAGGGEAQARDDVARAVAENSPAMLWVGDQNGKCVFLSRAQRDFWGVDPEDLSTFNWGDTTHPDDVQKLAEPFVKAMSARAPFSVEARYRRADGVYRTLRTEARPRFDGAGAFLGMTGVNTDITDQLRAEERTRMLMGELNHRTKNILSVVQAVARQTARNTAPEDFTRTFGDRLMGLAASNDLLLRNEWAGVEFADLAEAQLAHLADFLGKRIVLGGPSLKIAAGAAQTLGMALHELSTNSIKHGALSGENGRVDLRWSRGSDGSVFMIDWAESGVGPASEPTENGFGHSVIVDMVSSALDADVSVQFGEDGFRWLVNGRSAAALA